MTSSTKAILKLSAISIGCFLLLLIYVNKCSRKIQEPVNKYIQYVDSCETQLGKKIIIDNDTLVLLSFNKGNYVLSNGIEIDPEVVKKIGLIE